MCVSQAQSGAPLPNSCMGCSTRATGTCGQKCQLQEQPALWAALSNPADIGVPTENARFALRRRLARHVCAGLEQVLVQVHQRPHVCEQPPAQHAHPCRPHQSFIMWEASFASHNLSNLCSRINFGYTEKSNASNLVIKWRFHLPLAMGQSHASNGGSFQAPSRVH